MRDYNNNPEAQPTNDRWSTPGEVASLIHESADLLRGALIGLVGFAVLAWVSADGAAWLHIGACVLAVVMGLSAVWHLLFLVRAARRYAVELDEKAEADEVARRFLRGLADPGEGERG